MGRGGEGEEIVGKEQTGQRMHSASLSRKDFSL